MSLRLEVIAVHEQHAKECREALKNMSQNDPSRSVVEQNLKANESCIKFLSSITDEQGEVNYE